MAWKIVMDRTHHQLREQLEQPGANAWPPAVLNRRRALLAGSEAREPPWPAK